MRWLVICIAGKHSILGDVMMVCLDIKLQMKQHVLHRILVRERQQDKQYIFSMFFAARLIHYAAEHPILSHAKIHRSLKHHYFSVLH